MLEVPRPLQTNAHVGLPAVRDTVDETPGPALNRNLPTIEGKIETILQNPDYAIRFVNLGEYIEILSRQKIEPREATAFRPSKDSRETPLTRYLGIESTSSSSATLGGWVGAISLQTETALHFSINIRVFSKLRAMLSEAHGAATEESLEAVGERTRKEFAAAIREDYQARESRYILGRSPYQRFEQSIRRGHDFLSRSEGEIVRICSSAFGNDEEMAKAATESLLAGKDAPSPLHANSDLIRKVEKHIRVASELEARKGALGLLEQVYSGEKDTLSNRELRTIFLALSFADWDHPIQNNGLTNWKQYQIALAFHVDALTSTPSWGIGGEVRGWRILKSGKNASPEHLLAAIALVPDKKLWGIMRDYSEDSDRFSHPIFAHQGSLVFPNVTLLSPELQQGLKS